MVNLQLKYVDDVAKVQFIPVSIMPQAETPASSSNSKDLATTEFVKTAIDNIDLRS